MAIKHQRDLIWLLVGLLFFYFFILQLRAIWPFTIDDMYISLRYAKHWHEGHGLVWNVGDLPLEGYSNFSFVSLARLAMACGIDPVMGLKILGVIGLFASCVASYFLTRFWALASLAWIPALWLLAYQGEIIWSVSGLETTVYQALLCFAVVFILRGFGYQYDGREIKSVNLLACCVAGVLMALASMTRPEAPAFVLLFVLLLVLLQKKSRVRQGWLGVFAVCASFAVLFTPYFFWRWQLFGRLFPNPVYCKSITGAMQFSLDKQYLRLLWPFVMLALPALFMRKVTPNAKRCEHDIRPYFLWLPSVLYGLLLLDADPIVAFDNRLFLPAFTLFLPLALYGLDTFFCVSFRNRACSPWGVITAAILFMFLFIPMKSLTGYRYFVQNPMAGEALRHQIVRWLNQQTNEKAHVVLADSGLIPFYTQRYFIDSYCLNNAEMTRMHHVNMYQYFCEQIKRVKPTIIILTALIEHGQVIYTPADACLAQWLHMNTAYQWQKNFIAMDRGSSYSYTAYKKYKY